MYTNPLTVNVTVPSSQKIKVNHLVAIATLLRLAVASYVVVLEGKELVRFLELIINSTHV